MPQLREGLVQVNLAVPVGVRERLRSLAKANGRTVDEEGTHALERHLSQPPTVRTDVAAPPLEPASCAPTPQRRGRKPKAGKDS